MKFAAVFCGMTIVFATGCSKPADDDKSGDNAQATPEATVEGYLAEVKKPDPDETKLRAFMSKELQEEFDGEKGGIKQIIEGMKQIKDIKVGKATIDSSGDFASIEITFKSAKFKSKDPSEKVPLETDTTQLPLIKQGDKWLLHIRKRGRISKSYKSDFKSESPKTIYNTK